MTEKVKPFEITEIVIKDVTIDLSCIRNENCRIVIGRIVRRMVVNFNNDIARLYSKLAEIVFSEEPTVERVEYSYNNENDAKTVEGLFGSTYALIFSTEVQRAVMEFLNKDWRDDFVPDEFNELCACVYCNAMTTEKAREFVEKNGEKTITIPHFGKRGIPFIHYDIKTQYDV